MRSSSGSSLPARRSARPPCSARRASIAPSRDDARGAPRRQFDHARARELGVGAADGRRARAALARRPRARSAARCRRRARRTRSRCEQLLGDVAVARPWAPHRTMRRSDASQNETDRASSPRRSCLVAGCGGDDGGSVGAERAPVILATTTSTQDSGLLDVLVPAFERETGYQVKTIAVGSGEAIEMGERGEADVVLAHSPAAEEELMAAGKGRAAPDRDAQRLRRSSAPPRDPARIAGAIAAAALSQDRRGARRRSSRAATTPARTRSSCELWEEAGVTPGGELVPGVRPGHGRDAADRQRQGRATRSAIAARTSRPTSARDLKILVEGGRRRCSTSTT